MRALVLGASGHIGSAITRELLGRGYRVTALTRGSRLMLNLAGLPIRYIRGDIDHSHLLSDWIRGHHIVVDAAAPYPLRLPGYGGESFEELLTKAERRTKVILQAVRKHGAQLAYISSFSTLPHQRRGYDRWMAELLTSLHPYFAVKDLIESEIMLAAKRGLPAAILNPTGCLGPWDLKDRIQCFVPALLCGEVPAMTDQMLNVIDVRDVATGVVSALETKHYCERIPLVGRNVSNGVLFSWICEIGAVPPPRLVTSTGLSVIASYLAEAATATVGISTPMPALIAMLTYMHGYAAPSAAQISLHVFPRSLSETLVDTVEWYRKIGYC